MTPQTVLIGLHLLPHLLPEARADWFARLRPEPTDPEPVVEALRAAYPDTRSRFEGVRALLSAEITQERCEQAATEMRITHDSRAPRGLRPYGSFGCTWCQAPCQYGQVVALSLHGTDPEAIEDFLAPAQDDLLAMIGRVEFLAPSLLKLALPEAVREHFHLDARMLRDLSYCLVTELTAREARGEHRTELAGLAAAMRLKGEVAHV